MLVLSRRVGEEIVIDGQTRLIVLGIKGGVAKLGFVAPASVHVDRKEVYERRTTHEVGSEARRPANCRRPVVSGRCENGGER